MDSRPRSSRLRACGCQWSLGRQLKLQYCGGVGRFGAARRPSRGRFSPSPEGPNLIYKSRFINFDKERINEVFQYSKDSNLQWYLHNPWEAKINLPVGNVMEFKSSRFTPIPEQKKTKKEEKQPTSPRYPRPGSSR